MAGKTKLELTWIGKNKREKLEPRVLIEDEVKGRRVTSKDNLLRDNEGILIKGDNLLALKALEANYTGAVRCIYIDPPYNTGSAYKYYDDGVEHSLWLKLLRDRLIILRNLLSRDGSIWISLDDNESHYFRVMADEVFGRKNFVANVIWQKRYAPSNDALWLSDDHDHILCYAKDKNIWRPNPLPRTLDQDKHYKNPDDDPRGPWMSDNYTCAKSAEERPNLYYEITNPNTKEVILPKRTRVWAFEPQTHSQHVAENRIYWGKDGSNSTPRLKKFLNELRRPGRVPNTLWLYGDVGHTQDAKREAAKLNPTDPFPTPKPERLIERVLTIATNPDDLVLDSFAGSGTTGAVAHKMGRRWIMVELGDHADTHIVPRLKKVIDGKDPGGATETTGWQGGGGYRYFNLAPSLLEKDQWGQYVISKNYKPEMLSEAVCKLMGFTYAPSQDHFWQHGHSTENDFVYVTTQRLTHDALRKLSHEVGQRRTLLVCCRAHDENTFDNLTIRKIPNAVMAKCEWGRDDYSLNIQEAPSEPITDDDLNDDENLEAAE